jgi:hypothetical protein
MGGVFDARKSQPTTNQGPKCAIFASLVAASPVGAAVVVPASAANMVEILSGGGARLPEVVW